jgi:dihydrofolate reductase
MTKSILEIAISVDGYAAGLHDEQDWLEQFDDTSEYGFDTFVPTVGALIIGMRSYSLGIERGWFKNNAYGPSPIFVVCKERPDVASADADFHFVTSGIEDAYQQASEAAGDKNIYVFGGPSIVQQLLEKNLLDEIHLTFVPIILGQGIPLFANMRERRIQLECIDVKTFSKGLASVHYKVIR